MQGNAPSGSREEAARIALESAAAEFEKGAVQAAEARLRAVDTSDSGLAARRGQLLGVILASQGRMADAAAAYVEALRHQPDHPGIRFGLGYALNVLGRHDEALPHLQQAAAAASDFVEVHRTLGNSMLALGRVGEAIACYEQALALDPEDPVVHNSLGVALGKQDRRDESAGCFRRAFELDPNCAEAAVNLGLMLVDANPEAAELSFRQALAANPDQVVALLQLGNLHLNAGAGDLAAQSFQRVLALEPENAGVHCMLGHAHLAEQRLEDAAAAYRRAAELKPGLALAHLGLGRVRLRQNRLDEAAAALEKALALESGLLDARNNLATVYRLRGRLDEAEAGYRHIIAMQPEAIPAHLNLGNVLAEKMRLDEAEACFRRGLDAVPPNPNAHYSLGVLMLLKGDYSQGWREYEWRWELDGQKRRPQFGKPQWAGEDLAGQTILLWSEQGMGDTLQFVRYAPLVARRGARVILRCPKPLVRLLQSVEGIRQVVDEGAPPEGFDLQCPLMSLPLAFGTTAQTIPAQVPYLRADPGRAAYWRGKIGAGRPGRLKVGLVWSGMSRADLPGAYSVDLRRSLSLKQLAPLAQLEGADFYSLQKGPPGAEAAAPAAGMTLVDHTGELDDFLDTAGLVASLDLVITVDTSVAHLVGGMGKPVWILSRFDGCWRWLLDREDSPWYPTARIFRQRKPHEWQPVIEQVAVALRDFSG